MARARRRRQAAVTICWNTNFSSGLARTWLQICSQVRRAVPRPCWRPLKRTAALPSGVRGPVDFRAFLRLAAICLRVAIKTVEARGGCRGPPTSYDNGRRKGLRGGKIVSDWNCWENNLKMAGTGVDDGRESGLARVRSGSSWAGPGYVDRPAAYNTPG